MSGRRAYLFNTGCIRRALDSTRVYNYLLANGWSFTNSLPRADLIVVSTCGVVQKNEELSLIALANIANKRRKPARMVVTGCLPSIAPERIRAIPDLGAYEFIPTGKLDRFDAALNSTVRFEDIPDANLPAAEIGLLDYVLAFRLFRHSSFLSLYKRMSANRGFLKAAVGLSETLNTVRRRLGMSARDEIVPYYNIRIAEGCAFKCAYCSIKFATGRVKSKPIDRIVEEFEAGLAQGHKLIQLVCEDTGCYGIDIKTDVVALLRRLLEIEGDYQLILIDFGGYWLVKHFDELSTLFKENPDKIRELYVSLQSGSDDILKAMKRPERSAEVVTALQALKRSLPHLILRTTVIVGFPGETEEDFQKSVATVKRIDFDAVEVNKYEDRPGTASSMMPNKIPQAVPGLSSYLFTSTASKSIRFTVATDF